MSAEHIMSYCLVLFKRHHLTMSKKAIYCGLIMGSLLFNSLKHYINKKCKTCIFEMECKELVALLYDKPLSPDLLSPSLWGSISWGKRTFWMKTKLLFPDFRAYLGIVSRNWHEPTWKFFHWCAKQRNAVFSWKIFMLFLQNDTCSMHLRLK